MICMYPIFLSHLPCNLVVGFDYHLMEDNTSTTISDHISIRSRHGSPTNQCHIHNQVNKHGYGNVCMSFH